MSPTTRTVVIAAIIACGALVVSPWLVALGLAVLAAVTAVDSRSAAKPPTVRRDHHEILARGIASPLRITIQSPVDNTLRIRQPLPPDVGLTVITNGAQTLDGELVARRRGRHHLPKVVVRRTGTLGLMRSDHRCSDTAELLVYPDLPAARRLAHAVRTGTFREEGRVRGELGLGTDFELIREYVPDDDIRQVNWPATIRTGRPMSNHYRQDTDREIMCVVDAGRLMTGPVGTGSRLDVSLDAFAAVAAVADVLGDRIGVIAYNNEVLTELRPRRDGGRAAVRALFDLEAKAVDSDHERAFHRIAGGKRRLVIVFTDLMDDDAAASLIDAVPVLVKRHAVLVAAVTDPDLSSILATEPAGAVAVYRAAVAAELLHASDRAAARIQRSGATVVEASPKKLSAHCVGAYLQIKSQARL